MMSTYFDHFEVHVQVHIMHSLHKHNYIRLLHVQRHLFGEILLCIVSLIDVIFVSRCWQCLMKFCFEI